MIVFMFLFLPHWALDIFVTEKRVNHRRKYGLKIPAIFHFCGLGKAFKLTKKLKNKITKIGENLKETVRHY